MECLRRLLRRSSEALFLLQILSQHNVARLVQGLDNNVRQKLIQLTFNQLVCSEEGEQLASRLITSLMEVKSLFPQPFILFFFSFVHRCICNCS